MIDEKNVFEQPFKSGMRSYDNIQKIVTGQRHDQATGCFQDQHYCNMHFKVTDAFDADPKVKQQIKFTENLDRDEGTKQCFSLSKKQKKPFQIFYKEL